MSQSDDSSKSRPAPEEPIDIDIKPDPRFARLSPEEAKALERLYHQAYRELCQPVTGEEPADEPPGEIGFEQQVFDYLEKNRAHFHQKICVEFDYCARMKRIKNQEEGLRSLVLLSALFFDLGFGGIAAATWLSAKAALNIFCKCPP